MHPLLIPYFSLGPLEDLQHGCSDHAADRPRRGNLLREVPPGWELLGFGRIRPKHLYDSDFVDDTSQNNCGLEKIRAFP